MLTIFVSAGTVATETFGFTFEDTIILFLVVQISALVGAFAALLILAGPVTAGQQSTREVDPADPLDPGDP